MSRDMSSVANDSNEPLVGERGFRLSAAGFGLASALLAVTFIPGAPLLPTWLFFVLMGSAIFVGVHRVRGRRGIWTGTMRISTDGVLKNIPAGLRVPVQGVFLLMVLVAVLSFIHVVGGQAEIIHERYYLDDHGALTQVTHAAYEQSRIWTGRLFTAFPAMFFLGSACLYYQSPN